MKIKLVLFSLLFLLFSVVQSQNEIEEIVAEGITYHDNGEYEKAIKTYKEALALDPNSSLVHYELSSSYMNLQDYDNVIKHSDKVIKIGGPNAVLAYTTKGSAYDYQGKFKKAVKTYKKGISLFPEDYNIRFNLGITYYGGNELKNAFDEFEASANLNPQHASSHFYLGLVAYDLGRTTQALLAHYIFLFLEPVGKRSDLVWQVLDSGINKKKEELGGNINITLSDHGDDYDFMASDLMISLLSMDITSDSVEVDGVMQKFEPIERTDFEIFSQRSNSFFNTVGGLKEDNDKTDLWWGLYVYLLDKINDSEYEEVFFRMITQGKYEESSEWVALHENDIDQFLSWLGGEE